MPAETCVRCGLQEDAQKHNRQEPPPEGWHPFRSQAYLDGIEDALLFIREKHQPHNWRDSGLTIDTNPPFYEKHCTVCGAVNWGGKEVGVCFGNHESELGIIAANNRRATQRG